MIECRSEQRIPVNQPVKATLLDSGSPPDTQNLRGTVIDCSNGGIRVVVPRSLPVRGAVRVDVSDALILGEICHCVPHQDGYVIGLEIHHSLWNLARVAQVRAKYLNEAADRKPIA